METESLILVLDVGTTGGRAIIFDSNGRILISAYQEYQSIYVAQGVIDHDPQTWLNAIRDCVRQLKEEKPELISKLSAVSVTSQRATLLPVDQDGSPLLPAILWQDKRTVGECAEIEEIVGADEVYRRTGLKIDPYFSLPKLLWFRNKRSDIYKKASYFLTTFDYVIHALTGEFKTEWTQASRTMLFNVNDFQWDSVIAKKMNVDINKLPKEYPPGTIAGQVTKSCAEKTGLPEGLAVIMAGGDQQCAAVGLGAICPGIATVTTGTGSFVVAPVDFPVKDREQKVLSSASAIPGTWVIEAGIFTTGSTYRWLRDELFSSDVQYSKLPPYEVLNQEAGKSPPGANGVLHIPHYAGSAAPYWDAKATGILFNLTLGTKKSDVVRAYLEGIGFEIKKNLSIINSLLRDNGNQNLMEVRVSGGLVRSDLFNQIQADIYELKVTPGHTEQATALGAAMIGFVSKGIYRDFVEVSECMGKMEKGRRKYPNPKVTHLYRKLGRLHDKIYRSLSEANVYSITNKMKD